MNGAALVLGGMYVAEFILFGIGVISLVKNHKI